MGQPWCLRPKSIVRKTHLANRTKVDEVPTPNPSSQTNTYSNQKTKHNQTPLNTLKVQLGETLSKSNSIGQVPKINISSQWSTRYVPRDYAQHTLMLTKIMVLIACAQRTTRYTQRMQPSPKTPLRAYSIKFLHPKRRSKPKMMS